MIYLCTYDLGRLRVTTTVLELCLNRFFPVDFMFFRVLFNITHENGPPGTIRCFRASVLSQKALFTRQLELETKLARITHTFEKLEHYSDHHVLGRMHITRFLTVTCNYRIALYNRYFFRTSSNRSLANDTIPELT